MAKSEWYGRECLSHINNKLKSRMVLASNFVKDEAKRRVPVDTANLKGSLGYEVVEDNGEIVGRIGTNVSYAIYVEYGDEMGKKPRKVGQMPFLRPALLDNKEQIRSKLAI